MAPDEPEDPATPTPTPDTPADEPRGKELFSRSREEMAERLDPATLRELASWFARPSTEMVTEAALVDEEDAAVKRLNESRAAAAAAVTPAMLHYATRHERSVARNLPERPVPRLRLDETILGDFIRKVLDRTHDEEATDERFFQQPEDVRNALEQNAPQAILRDLHRPVTEFSRGLERVFTLPEVDETESIAFLMKQHYKMPLVPLSTTALVEARAALAQYVTLNWETEVAAAAKARKDQIKAASW